jgi:hypothetical protein
MKYNSLCFLCLSLLIITNCSTSGYRKAAEQGHAESQFDLGYRYYVGLGVPQDYKQAIFWFKKAAEQGLSEAQNGLGMGYLEGLGFPLDYEQAIYWFREAAGQEGYVFPSELLGVWLYEFEDSEGFYIEQTLTFNSNGSGTIETKKYGIFNFGGNILRVPPRPEDITVFYLSPSPQQGNVILKIDDEFGQISYEIENGYLSISGIDFNLFDLSIPKYKKLSGVGEAR